MLEKTSVSNGGCYFRMKLFILFFLLLNKLSGIWTIQQLGMYQVTV